MILALILFVGIFGGVPASGDIASAAQTQSTPDQQSTKAPQDSASTQQAGSAQDTAGKPAHNSASSSAHSPISKTPGKGQKKPSANCDSAASQNTSVKAAKSNDSADASTRNSAAVRPCPPKKVIVRQGSTSDPSIEVVGGAEGRQASDERNTAIQMLETTEANLKKMEGTHLDSNKQAMIKQVRDFMDQSKAATSSGDLDQGRTLAWKAQLLSEELLRTQK
jgi:hypothetical protein